MAEKKNDILVLSNTYLSKAGIELPSGENAATQARAELMLANGNNGYVPQNKGSEMAVTIANYARQELGAGENAMKHVCVALASLDMSGEYAKAHDKNGTPYTSMLGFAMDVLPNLAKSTVAGYVSVGRNIYVPAIREKFGKASETLLALPPSTLDAIKANLNRDDARQKTIDAIRHAANQGTVTQRLAKAIAKVVRDAIDNKSDKNATPAIIVKAAKGDENALKIVYPTATQTDKRTGGATANGGNKEAQASHDTEAYNAVKARLIEYVKPIQDKGKRHITLDAQQLEGLSGYLKRALTSDDINDARFAVRAMLEIITG